MLSRTCRMDDKKFYPFILLLLEYILLPRRSYELPTVCPVKNAHLLCDSNAVQFVIP